MKNICIIISNLLFITHTIHPSVAQELSKGCPKKIAVIGTGYVGLVSGPGWAEMGNTVVCADVDEKKIATLLNGQIPIYEPGLKELVDRNREAGRLSFTADVAQAIQDCDINVIAVGTPMKEDGSADLSYVCS